MRCKSCPWTGSRDFIWTGRLSRPEGVLVVQDSWPAVGRPRVGLPRDAASRKVCGWDGILVCHVQRGTGLRLRPAAGARSSAGGLNACWSSSRCMECRCPIPSCSSTHSPACCCEGWKGRRLAVGLLRLPLCIGVDMGTIWPILESWIPYK
jgi:hypothetical protein